MKATRNILMTGLIIFPAVGTAQVELDSYRRTQDMATLLAAEQFCGLSYDQAAIAAWVTAQVKPNDLEFASTLQGLTLLSEVALPTLSTSAKTAHCTAVTQSARELGFID